MGAHSVTQCQALAAFAACWHKIATHHMSSHAIAIVQAKMKLTRSSTPYNLLCFLAIAKSLASECKCTFNTNSASPPSGVLQVRVTSLSGTGRTGNIAREIQYAFAFAAMCRSHLTLPRTTKDLEFGKYGSIFDFSSLPTVVEQASRAFTCRNLTGDVGLFKSMHLHKEREEGLHQGVQLGRTEHTWECVRQYLGICDQPKFCSEFSYLTNQTLVAHVRQGDIFPRGFNPRVYEGNGRPPLSHYLSAVDDLYRHFSWKSGVKHHVHKLYGQPPLSYYLSAIKHSKAQNVIFVGERTQDESPVWLMARLLTKFGVPGVNYTFSQNSWAHDLRLLLCAQSLVESRSTLHSVIQFGFASVVYRQECMQEPHARILKIMYPPKYDVHHLNSRQEWLDMLLMEASSPLPCQE